MDRRSVAGDLHLRGSALPTTRSRTAAGASGTRSTFLQAPRTWSLATAPATSACQSPWTRATRRGRDVIRRIKGSGEYLRRRPDAKPLDRRGLPPGPILDVLCEPFCVRLSASTVRWAARTRLENAPVNLEYWISGTFSLLNWLFFHTIYLRNTFSRFPESLLSLASYSLLESAPYPAFPVTSFITRC
jgi:hypothetical protein